MSDYCFAFCRLRHLVDSYKLDALRILIRSRPLTFGQFRLELENGGLCPQCEQGCRKFLSNKENHRCYDLPTIVKALKLALKDALEYHRISIVDYDSLCLFFGLHPFDD